MTRTIGAALEAHYQGAVTTIALCVNVVISRWQPRIIDITKANPGQVTTRWAHGYSTGDSIKIVGVEGMTQVNDAFYTITVTGTNTFTLGVDTSGFSTYLKGSWYGTARKALGFTKHTSDITFNGLVYHASGGADGSSVDTTADLGLTSRDLHALIDSVLITVEDLERGLYAGAEYETFEVNYQDLSQGRLLLEYGRLGDITVQDQVFVAEGLSLVNLLHQNIGPQISVLCRAQLGTRVSDVYDERYGCKVRINPPTWLASTAYTTVQNYDAALGSIVKPSVYSGRHFKCTTAGTSGGSEPSWVTTIGATTADNTVVWTAIDALTKEGTVASVVDDRSFKDAGRLEASGYFDFGLLTFLTGSNKGWSSEIREFRYTAVPIFQEAGAGASTTATAGLSPAIPSTGLLAGDAFFLHVTTRNLTTTVNTPSGWTLITGPDNIDTVGRSYVFGKVASGSESGTVSVTFASNSGETKMARIYRFRGTGITMESTSIYSGNDTTIEAPSLTPLGPNRLAIAFVSQSDDNAMAPWAGETGGNWVEATSAFLTSVGLDGGQQLQTADLSSGSAISGGVQTLSVASAWLVQGFVLAADPAKITLRDKPPATVQIGDTYELETGCDKILATCKAKFNNVYNFRGEPYIPGFKKQFIYPDSH